MSTKYPYYNEGIPVSDLFLDTHNPRLPDYMHGKAETDIIDYMVLQESTLELMQAIGEKGFFPGELLLVVEKEGNFLVVEGNRRLTAVKLLNNPDVATAQTTSIKKILQQSKAENKNISSLPCMVFEKGEDIHDYLGYRHVTGIQPWNLRQKAQYVNYLMTKNFADLNVTEASEEIRKIIGSKRDYVKRILIGFDVFTKLKDHKFFGVKGLTTESFFFSYIIDSLSRSQIVSFLGIDFEKDNPADSLDLDSLEKWTKWLYEPIEIRNKVTTRLKGKSGDLNDLNAILGNEEAKRQFIENSASLAEAYTFTEDFDKTFRDSVFNSLSELKRADSIKHRISVFYPSLEDDLRNLINLARTIRVSKDELTDDPFKKVEKE